MELTISLSEDVMSRLAHKAAVVGIAPSAYAAQLLIRAMSKASIDELLEPVRSDFANSGMSEEEILQFGRDILNRVRHEKRSG